MRRFLLLLVLIPLVAGCDSGTTDEGEVIIEDLDVGTGAEIVDKDAVMVSFVGKLEDGTVFQVSNDLDPFAFTVGAGSVIKGWDLGVPGMRVGGTRRLTIPASLAFGKAGRCDGDTCPVPPNATVVFDITVIRKLDEPYIFDEITGTGPEAKDGLLVVFTYIGAFTNGSIFASSNFTGTASQTVLGQGDYIEGIERGMVGMRVGGVRRILIPPSMAYGAEGYSSIPPYAVLRFTIELLDVVQ